MPNSMSHFILAILITIISLLTPVIMFSSTIDLSPDLDDLSMKFSNNFCRSIENGIPPEKAGEKAAIQLTKGLLFSPIINEIMSAPKEDLVASLSNNIYDKCGNNLGSSKEELDSYLAQYAGKIPNKSTKSIRMPPIRQKPFK